MQYEYEKLEFNDVKCIGNGAEKFLNDYNSLVNQLNDDIVKLDELNKKFGIVSVLDTCGFDGVTGAQYRTKYNELFKQHSETYEKYLDMQSDLIRANALDKNIVDDTDEHDL